MHCGFLRRVQQIQSKNSRRINDLQPHQLISCPCITIYATGRAWTDQQMLVFRINRGSLGHIAAATRALAFKQPADNKLQQLNSIIAESKILQGMILQLNMDCIFTRLLCSRIKLPATGVLLQAWLLLFWLEIACFLILFAVDL